MSNAKRFLMLPLLFLFALTGWAQPGQAQAPSGRIVVDDFEGYPTGVPPHQWKRAHKKSRSLVDVPRVLERDDDYFEIVAEGGSKRARVFTRNESTQVVKPNGEGYDWDINTHPYIAWDWRALHLPEGAREDEGKYNDAGAAVYVTFDKDWLGRPRSIKYTYSSTLPVGTVAKYGPLRVIVVSSGADGDVGWVHVERDVVADYRRVFDREPPEHPLSITLWSDSDDTKSGSEVLFDNLVLLPAGR